MRIVRLALVLFLFCSLGLASERPRVIISTDIGGSDPDDFQSMVHLLVYADRLEIEGLISSPPGKGRASHIHEALDAYASDEPQLKQHSADYPSAELLRKLTRQGAVDPQAGERPDAPSEGAKLIIEAAGRDDPQPLWVLVWGSMTDVAQAVAAAPGIKSKIRVYSIGSWNTRQDERSRNYVFAEHPDLWWIESDTTFRGMYQGGNQSGDLSNTRFVEEHVRGHGALGELFWGQKRDIKMGDTPSVLYLLHGDVDNPSGESWGGSYQRPAPEARPTYWRDRTERDLRVANRNGAQTVARWREQYLRDWASRMDRLNVQN
jgi:hypothetical protein